MLLPSFSKMMISREDDFGNGLLKNEHKKSCSQRGLDLLARLFGTALPPPLCGIGIFLPEG
jgi:hypothetical protein